MTTTVNTQFILVLSFIHYCMIIHMNNCKPTFAPPRVRREKVPLAEIRWVIILKTKLPLNISSKSLTA